MRIGLLNAAFSKGVYENFNRELDSDVVNIDAHDPPYPDYTAFDGFVVSGSRTSVYDEDASDWVKPLKAYIASIAAEGIPILGVCFGHQIVASALGGKVTDIGEYEIGYTEVRQLTSDRLFDGIETLTPVFATHSDTVVKLPPNAQIIAVNDYGIQSYRVGDAWGIQFHPEFDVESARQAVLSKDFDEERERYLLDSISEETHKSITPATQTLDNFCDFVESKLETDKLN